MTDIIAWLKAHAANLPDGSPERPFFEEGIAELERCRSLASAAAMAVVAKPLPKPTAAKAKKPAKKKPVKKAKRR